MSEELTGKTVMVPFAGTEIMVVDDGDQRPVPMKPFVEGIGLEWKHIHTFVLGDEVLKQGIRVTRIPTSSGVQEMTALDMKYIPLFLAKLNPSRYSHKPELQARLVKYQVECAEVLYQYFRRGFVVNPNMSAEDMEQVFNMVVAQKRQIETQQKLLQAKDDEIDGLNSHIYLQGEKINALTERNTKLVLKDIRNGTKMEEMSQYLPDRERQEGEITVKAYNRRLPKKKTVSKPCQQTQLPVPQPPPYTPNQTVVSNPNVTVKDVSNPF